MKQSQQDSAASNGLVLDLESRCERFGEVRFALLFGSQASGSSHPFSDIDLAIYIDPRLSQRERFDLRLAIVAELSDLGDIDVVVLNDAPALLAHRALMGRRLLVRDKTSLVRFSVRTLGAVEDGRYFRSLHSKARERRLQEGSFGRP